MQDAKPHPKLWHGVTTFGAVWLAMAVAGMVPTLVPSGRSGEVASLLAYTGLIAAFARWTEAGRRSTVAYFVGGFFSPMFCFFFLLLPLLPRLPPSFFENGLAMLLFVGLNVGIQAHGGPDAPLEAYLPLMWLNLLLPIAAVIGVRAFARYHRSD